MHVDNLNGPNLWGSSIDPGTELTFEVPGYGELHGYVLTASHYGADGWFIEWTRTQGTGYAGYWKQGPDGGKLTMVQSRGLHLQVRNDGA